MMLRSHSWKASAIWLNECLQKLIVTTVVCGVAISDNPTGQIAHGIPVTVK